jgi:Protein phosphatase 2C
MASSIGTSHAASGTPCQDSCHCRLVDAGGGETVLVAVASDGAGTARCAHVGSQVVCSLIGDIAQDFLDKGGQVAALDRKTAELWLDFILAELSKRASCAGNDLREYACTLLAVVASDTAAMFLQIGDGAIVVSDGIAAGWSYVFWPDHGEFANTTTFVVSPEARQKLGFQLVRRPIREVALFTDGLENLVLHKATRTVHEPFFRSMFQAVRRAPGDGPDEGLSGALEKYLATPAITDRTDDDKTLILATRLPPDGAPGTAA